jgi:tetratricopeptide (TPR) repeat protein
MMRHGLAWLRGLFRRPVRLLALVSLLTLVGLGIALAGTQVWAYHHYRAAQEALRRYRLSEAQAHLQTCLRIWPYSYQTRLQVAQTARRLGDLEEAERQLTRCQEMRGGFPEEVMVEQALLRAQRGGMDAATSFLRPLVEQNHPATPLILEAMAKGYSKVYRYTDAAAVLDLWVERSPDDMEARFLRGWVLEQLGVAQLALDDYRRALEIDPENDECRLQLAVLLMDENHPVEALEHLERLQQQRPNDPQLLVRIARCQMALGRHPEASAVLSQVLQDSPRFRPALCAQGQLSMELNDPKEAEKWLRAALAMDSADFQSQFTLSKSLRQQGRDREALAVEERVTRIEMDISRIRNIIKEEFPKAPHDPALMTEIGTILLRAGSDREGLQWLHSALREDPGYASAHRALADYFEGRGDARQAAQHRKFLGTTTGPERPASGPSGEQAPQASGGRG